MIGQRINNYEIVTQIGEGGMGAVYMAQHPFIDRKAAIKVLRAGLASEQTLVGRFFNEARAATAIRHPNIIDVFDVGVISGTNTPYLMMELLEGESLSKRLKRMGRIRVGDAVEFAFQTASALTAAHKKGIIHRDLKPENLFLVGDPNVPGREIVKVLDFGIAKLRGDFGPGTGGEIKTQTGTLMGTPPYMSPEQCRGVSSQIDHRTDIYALGIILFEMLCGTRPFTGAGFGDILVAHLTQEPPSPRTHNAGIPEHLERAILRALAKKPDDRFASMGDFQTALGAGPARTEAYVTASGAGGAAAGVAATAAVGAYPREEQKSSSTSSSAVRAPAAFDSISAAPAVEPQAAGERTQQNTTTFSASAGMVAVPDGDGAGDTEIEPSRSKRGALVFVGGLAAAATGVALFLAFGGGPAKNASGSAGSPAASGSQAASGAEGSARPGASPAMPAPARPPAPAPPAAAAPAEPPTTPPPVSKPAVAKPAPAASAAATKPASSETKPARKTTKTEKKPKPPAEEPYKPLKL